MTLRSFRLSLLILSLATVVSLGRSAYPAGNATETFKGPGPWIDVTDPAFGAKGDGVTDDVAGDLARRCVPFDRHALSGTVIRQRGLRGCPRDAKRNGERRRGNKRH